MINVASEELAEHEHHYEELAEGREYAPRHAKHRAFVTLLKVSVDQLAEQERIGLHVPVESLQSF